MGEVKRVAAKKHECNLCYEPILPGQKYRDLKYREPVFEGDEDSKQIGINYVSTKYHDDHFVRTYQPEFYYGDEVGGGYWFDKFVEDGRALK